MALYENGKRISGIRDFPAYTWAEYHALSAAQRPKVWKCTDRDYTEIPRESVSVTADGSKTYAQLFNELWSLIDVSKITINSKLVRESTNNLIWSVLFFSSANVQLSYAQVVNNQVMIQSCMLSTASKYEVISSGSYSNNSSSVPGNGLKFTFYY